MVARGLTCCATLALGGKVPGWCSGALFLLLLLVLLGSLQVARRRCRCRLLCNSAVVSSYLIVQRAGLPANGKLQPLAV